MLIRQARIGDAAGIAKVHVDTWRTTYPGIVLLDYLDNLSYETHTQRWITWLSNPQTYAYVAEDELGGKQVKTMKATLGGATVDEVAYGWTDIRTLLKE